MDESQKRHSHTSRAACAFERIHDVQACNHTQLSAPSHEPSYGRGGFVVTNDRRRFRGDSDHASVVRHVEVEVWQHGHGLRKRRVREVWLALLRAPCKQPHTPVSISTKGRNGSILSELISVALLCLYHCCTYAPILTSFQGMRKSDEITARCSSLEPIASFLSCVPRPIAECQCMSELD